MAKNDTVSRISPYAERLLDDYIYEQLGDATERLQDAYSRVSRRPAKKSLEDKRLRNQLSGAAESLRRAALAAAGREPEPKSRMPKVLLLLAVAIGLAAFLARKRSQGGDDYLPTPEPAAAPSNGAVQHGGERLSAT